MIRVLMCGSRDWSKPVPVDVVVGGFGAVYGFGNVVVIHGGAGGADSMASSAAIRHGIETELFPALWGQHDREGVGPVRCSCPPDADRCRAAGPRRNQQMIDEGKPDLVVAFTDDLEGSRGTCDMVRRAREHRIPCYIFGRALREFL